MLDQKNNNLLFFLRMLKIKKGFNLERMINSSSCLEFHINKEEAKIASVTSHQQLRS